MNRIRLIPSLVLFTLALGGSHAAPLGSAFTYQGRLTEGGAPANGSYNLRLELFDSDVGPNHIGNILTNAGVSVTNGLFTTALDFGSAPFNGTALWLQIGVRTNGSAADFATLNPRQRLTPAPYALYTTGAGVAATALAAPWSGLTGVPAGFLDGIDSDTLYSAGMGLTLSGTIFSVNFGGSGALNQAARSDHHHDATYWKLTGNGGITPGLHFLGTTDNQPLEFRVNNTPALRLLAGDVGPNHLGGHAENAILDGAGGATIAGGGEAGAANFISDHWGFIGGGSTNRAGNVNGDPADAPYGTIAGGVLNLALAYAATVGGGQENTASQTFATVVGGRTNTASGVGAFVGGGTANVASGGRSVVGGGLTNAASGLASTVPGGRENAAAGNFSFAAGRRAKAQHPGAFVWADNTDTDFASTAPNQFLIRADKVGIGTATPQTTLDVAGIITWGASSLAQDQGGSIELGDSLGAGAGPYLDFHFGMGAAEDFNVRLINDAAGRLTVDAGTLRITGNVGIGLDTPSAPLEVAGMVKATRFMGDGSELALLNASSLASGTVAEARIDALLARDSEILPAVLASDGTGSGLNADLFDGLNSSAFWQLSGNSGTTPNLHFLGTTDNQALELKVNNSRALRLEPTPNSVNVIGGFVGNFVSAGVEGATIAGGGTLLFADFGLAYTNRVFADFGTIGGGFGNTVRDLAATIGGGFANSIAANAGYSAIGGGAQNRIRDDASIATISGGLHNTIDTNSPGSTISGGERNYIHTNSGWSVISGGQYNTNRPSAAFATIGGGANNVTTNSYAVVPGGRDNTAGGAYSLAGGRRAKANHTGTFVWADSTDVDFTSSANNEFAVRAGGGMRVVTGGAGVTFDGQPVLSGMVSSAQIADGTVSAADVNAPSFSTTFWKADGNSSTTPGTHFVGTSDNQALELKVNGTRALRLEPNATGPNVIGGNSASMIDAAAGAATIGGGGFHSVRSGANFATISGGRENTIQNDAFNSTIGGGNQNTIEAGAHNATIGGGVLNRLGTNSAYATIGGGIQNTVQTLADRATIGGGELNVIQQGADYATIGGGIDNIIEVNAASATIAGGNANVIVGNADFGVIGGGTGNSIETNAINATIGGGNFNTIHTNADYATIPGGRFAKANEYGQLAYASGRFTSDGDAQTSVFVLRRTTTSATELELFLDGAGRRMIVPDDTSWSFDIMIVGRSSTGASAAYKFTGLIVNNAGVLFFLGPTKTLVHEDVAAWDIDVNKDVANNALVIKATGAAATTIRWVASVRTVEVTH